MRARRRQLAKSLLTLKDAEVPTGQVEEVLGFYEDLGAMVRKGWMDKEIVWQSFAEAARQYWSALSQYVTDFRQKTGDASFYSEYQYLVGEMERQELRHRGMKHPEEIAISSARNREFIEGEATRPD